MIPGAAILNSTGDMELGANQEKEGSVAMQIHSFQALSRDERAECRIVKFLARKVSIY
jgi:hypothetical protein